MGLTMQEKKKIARITSERYIHSSKSQRSVIIDEFVATTGYNRSYATYVLRYAYIKSTKPLPKKEKLHRPKRVIYDRFVASALLKIWPIMDYICGRRLAAAMPDVLDNLTRNGFLKTSVVTHDKLLKISPSSIERILKHARKDLKIKGKSFTKPGTLLKKQIPVRTFDDWNENSPGFVEMDLVAHCGGNASGDFINSLNFTDINTAWTETVAVQNKAQSNVFKGIILARSRLPFPLKGIDSDNGNEFINYHLLKYCQDEKITFTRSRAYRKNDNCFIEQKNYSVVRRFAGYARYDTAEELRLLNLLYTASRLYLNFFTPSAKLIFKQRIGSKVIKKYDKPLTPFKRVLASPDVTDSVKACLTDQFASLNLVSLFKTIRSTQKALLKFGYQKNKLLNK